ncbi:MaoC family dehydratase [Brevibacillus composti]|uniref:MaoC family dehydratase n=1 Tax=Brevibacillus composti TaxID=2796470 RepID=A0A7T5JQ49_9BACL|nr:MaoC family dehydratase [Brevibacillus composti]QQE75974.1 MaoC family dehydratase [Brevibacillus composti]QUO43000.1 MaoC family dehydratase [Brevibacillus composti]
MGKYFIGQKASFGKTITEADLAQFAGISGDFNPIHIDSEYAKQTRFGQRIAHGMLTTSLLSGLLGMHLPGKGSVYLGQTLRFVKPVFIGDTVTAQAEVVQFDPDKGIMKLRTECLKQDGTLVLEGEATMLVPREETAR